MLREQGHSRVGRRGLPGMLLTAGLVVVAAWAPAAGAAATGAASGGLPGGQALTGTFSIQSGQCQSLGPPSGSYLELSENGVPVPNTSSPCVTYTLLSQGSQGLVSGAYQLDPAPTFDASGNSLANGLFRPVNFLGTRFGGATTCADQQHAPTPTGACGSGASGFAAPQLYAEPIGTGGCTANLLGALGNAASLTSQCLYGNLLGFGVTWNGNGTCASGSPGSAGCYDQGAETDASLSTTRCVSSPVADCSITGSYDPTTGAYSLTLQAKVVGTSFNGAVGTYHLTGHFTPGKVKSSSSSAGGSNQGSGSKQSSSAPSGQAPKRRASSSSATRTVTALEGVLHIDGGACAGSGKPTGSWIQLSKGGGPIPNPNSACDSGNYTPVTQGATGLKLGSFQPNPSPTFDGSGNSLADAILTPTEFLGARFGAATDPRNEQTSPSGPSVFPAPSATVDGTALSADMSAVNFTYNGPANGTCASGGGTGCYAVGSSEAGGSYDSATGHYVLSWTATIQGGSFNGASATFYLTGQFVGHEVRQVVAAGTTSTRRIAAAAAAGTTGTSASAPSAALAAGAPTVPGSALGTAAPQVAGSTQDPTLAIGPLVLEGSNAGPVPAVAQVASLALLAALVLGSGYLLIARRR